MKKKVLSAVFSSILSLFLAIVLLVGTLSAFAYETVCDQQLLLSTGKESGYTDQLYDEIKYKWENLLSITGVMDTDPIMQVLTPETVNEAALSYLRDAYTGTANIESQSLRDDLEAEVREYAYSNNIHATPQAELDQNISDLVSACMKEYTNAIKIPLLPRLLGAVSKIGPYLKMIPIVCAICAAAFLLFLFFLQSRRADTLYYACISTGTNALLILGGIWMAGHYRVVDRLPVEISALRTLVVSYLNDLFEHLQPFGDAFLLAALLLLLLYALVLVVTVLLNRRRKQNNISQDIPAEQVSE